MGLTPQQKLLHLEWHNYFEVYYNNKRYGICCEEDKEEFEEKFPNKFTFKHFDLGYDNYLSPERLELLLELLETDPEKLNKELESKKLLEIILKKE